MSNYLSRPGLPSTQRAGFLARYRVRSEDVQRRAAAVLDALGAECEALGLERGSPEFWLKAERRATTAVSRWQRQ